MGEKCTATDAQLLPFNTSKFPLATASSEEEAKRKQPAMWSNYPESYCMSFTASGSIKKN